MTSYKRDEIMKLMLPEADFSWSVIVMVVWAGTQVVSHCLPEFATLGSTNPSHLFTTKTGRPK